MQTFLLNGIYKINSLESGIQWGKCVVKIVTFSLCLKCVYPFKLNGISTFVNWPSPLAFKGLFWIITSLHSL